MFPSAMLLMMVGPLLNCEAFQLKCFRCSLPQRGHLSIRSGLYCMQKQKHEAACPRVSVGQGPLSLAKLVID